MICTIIKVIKEEGFALQNMASRPVGEQKRPNFADGMEAPLVKSDNR